MKRFLVFLVALIAATSAIEKEFDLSQVETKKLYVPAYPEELLRNISRYGYIERQREDRIANGMDAAEGQFPYTVRLTVHDTDGAIFVCTGVIIDPNYILTVRHCFDPVLTYMVTASVGTVHQDGSGWTTRISSQWWFAPPIDGWNPDLAVCRMDSPFPMTDRIGSIRLPSRQQMVTNYEFAQYPINIVGWGRLADGNMASTLQWARFRIETNCWSNRRPTHMCSDPVDGRHVETRGGDSGGPWVTTENGIETLIAIHEGSTGGSARWWFRGTRLTSFLTFISSVTGIPIRDN